MAKLTSSDEISATKQDVDEFLRVRSREKADMDESKSNIGAAHKKLIDDKGCNKKGLNTFASFANMKPNKRADALRTFDKLRAYYDNEWANPDLVDQAQGSDGAPTPANDQAA